MGVRPLIDFVPSCCLLVLVVLTYSRTKELKCVSVCDFDRCGSAILRCPVSFPRMLVYG